MRSRKYDGGVLVALSGAEQTTVDNDFVGNAAFDAADTSGLTMVIDFTETPTNRWLGVNFLDEDTSPNFDECVNVEATAGGKV